MTHPMRNYLQILEEAHLQENGALVVPGVNTTDDVGPNEISIQAAKFGNEVDAGGVPPMMVTPEPLEEEEEEDDIPDLKSAYDQMVKSGSSGL